MATGPPGGTCAVTTLEEEMGMLRFEAVEEEQRVHFLLAEGGITSAPSPLNLTLPTLPGTLTSLRLQAPQAPR